MDAASDLFQGIGWFQAHRGLIENGPTIHLTRHKMNRASRDLNTPAVGLSDSIQAGKTRQQTGMEVDDAAGKRREELGLQNPHEAREHNQVGPGCLDCFDKAILTGTLKLGLEWRRIDKSCRHSKSRAKGKNARRGLVRQDPNHLRNPEPAGLLSQQDRLGIAPTPRA